MCYPDFSAEFFFSQKILSQNLSATLETSPGSKTGLAILFTSSAKHNGFQEASGIYL